MTRSKSPAQRAPQSIEAATALLARYAEASLTIAALEAARGAEIAAIASRCDLAVAPLAGELKEIVKQLKPWWAASFDALTNGGKRKSIELGGCQIGYRVTPPKVEHTHGKDDAAVEVLRPTAWFAKVVRISYALDKPAILKALDEEVPAEEDLESEDVLLSGLGFASKQTEQFFVDVVAPASLVELLVPTEAADAG